MDLAARSNGLPQLLALSTIWVGAVACNDASPVTSPDAATRRSTAAADASSGDAGSFEIAAPRLPDDDGGALDHSCELDAPLPTVTPRAACEECPDNPTDCRVESRNPSLDSYYQVLSAYALEAELLQRRVEYWIRQAARFSGLEPSNSAEYDLVRIQGHWHAGFAGLITGPLDIETASSTCTSDPADLLACAVNCDPTLDPDVELNCTLASGESVSRPVPCAGRVEPPELSTACEAVFEMQQALLTSCLLSPSVTTYSLSAGARAKFEASPEEGAVFDRRMQCYGASVTNAVALGERIGSLLAARDSAEVAHRALERAAVGNSADDETCAESQLALAPTAFSALFEGLEATALLAAELQAATR